MIGAAPRRRQETARPPAIRGGIRAPLRDNLHLILDIRDSMTFFRFADDLGIAYPLIYSLDIGKTQHSLGVFFGLRYLF